MSTMDWNGTACLQAEFVRERLQAARPATTLLAIDVLCFVIPKVLARLDGPPPLLMFDVPVDGAAKRFFKIVPWRPAELILHFARVDGVAPVVAGAVLHI